METMKKFDRKAMEDRFYSLFEHLFHEIDQNAIRKDVTALRKKYPDDSRERLAGRLTRKASVSTAIIGAGAGAPGGSIGILAMAPDIFNLVRQQSKLVLSIAFLYDQEPGIDERFKEVLATLAVATGTTAGRQGVRYLVVKGLEGKTSKVVLEKIAGKFLSRKAAAIAPVVGSVAGASFNYFAVRGVGRVAIDYYSRLLDDTKKSKRVVKGKEDTGPPRRKPAKKKARASSPKGPAKKATAKTPEGVARKKRSAKKASARKESSRRPTSTGGRSRKKSGPSTPKTPKQSDS